MRLVDRKPDPPASALVAGLVPPPRFADVSFDSYEPAHPTQAAAQARLRALAGRFAEPRARRVLWRRSSTPAPRCVYLDGGFGVGKTHLLASLWHAVPAAPAGAAGHGAVKAYASFAQLVALAGALGRDAVVAALGDVRLLCVDEFELDDPGNTRIVTTLLRRLVEGGACIAATSNTLPGQLGEGRFDAERFRREIDALAAVFDVVRIDGEDYRHRGVPRPPPAWSPHRVIQVAAALGARASLDDGPALLDHLRTVHPARYAALVGDLAAVCVTDVRPLRELADALRVAWLVDVLYDREVAVALSGVDVDELVPATHAAGPYRKTFGRCRSRLVALVDEAAALAA